MVKLIVTFLQPSIANMPLIHISGWLIKVARNVQASVVKNWIRWVRKQTHERPMRR
jgi:hypothetical protein